MLSIHVLGLPEILPGAHGKLKANTPQAGGPFVLSERFQVLKNEYADKYIYVYRYIEGYICIYAFFTRCLPKTLIMIPNMETLHDLYWVLWTHVSRPSMLRLNRWTFTPAGPSLLLLSERALLFQA